MPAPYDDTPQGRPEPDDAAPPAGQALRDALMGLGERSMRKSFYPELKKRLNDLELYISLLDQAPDAIVLFSWGERRVLEANHAACQLLALPREALLGSAIDGHFPDLFPRHADDPRNQPHAPLTSRCMVLSFPGQRRFECSISTHAIKSSAYGVLIARDVTQRERMQQALAASESRLQLALDAAGEGIWDWNLATNVFYVSPRWRTMLGLSPADATCTFHEWLSLLHPEDVAMAEETVRRFLESGQEKYTLEVRMRHADGGWRWILSRGKIIERDAQDRPLRFIGAHADITDLKAAQRTLERKNEELHVLFALSRTLGGSLSLEEVKAKAFEKVVSILHPTVAFFYVLREGELVVSHFHSERPELTRERFEGHAAGDCLCGSAWRNTESVYSENLLGDRRCTLHSCKKLGLKALVALPIIAEGRKIALLSLGFDQPRHLVAERVFLEAIAGIIAGAMFNAMLHEHLQHSLRSLEETRQDLEEARQDLEWRVVQRTRELEDANARLRELDTLKDAFLTTVSHDLRTPLTSILGFAKIIRKDFLRHFNHFATDNARLGHTAARMVQNLDVIAQEGDRLARLINDFLDLSRIEAGHGEWLDQDLNLADLVRGAANAVSGLFFTKPDVVLRVEVDGQPIPVRADPDRLTQLVVNLLSNAAKFTDAGHVLVAARRDGHLAVLRVEDTGRGIDAEDLPRVFDKFYQAAAADTLQVVKGSGIGLAICKQIAEHYQGGIAVASRPGEGSVFTVTLPLAGDAAWEALSD